MAGRSGRAEGPRPRRAADRAAPAGRSGEEQPRADRSRAPARTPGKARDEGARPPFGRRPDGPATRPPRRRPAGKPGTDRPANPHPAHAAAADGQGEPQRIAKLLARAGVASRREIERMIEEGRIAKDGVLLDTPATLLTSLHGVTVDGVAVAAPAPARLFLFHKPTGCLTTERDPAGRPTIYDRLPEGLPRLMPIGRLDMNTEGLLLLTSDGGFKRQMELPATGVPRTYRARAFGEVSQQQLEDLFDGLEIDGIRYGPIEANLERRTGRNQWIEMTLTEGKNREVRRVLEHLDLKVNRLIRTAYGPFTLGELPVGAVEEVRQHDLVQFRSALKKAPAP
jgi:23S rRNA pseudouridine2605 synthase